MSRWLRFSSNINTEISAECDHLVNILLRYRSRIEKYKPDYYYERNSFPEDIYNLLLKVSPTDHPEKNISYTRYRIKELEEELVNKVLEANFQVSDKVKDYIKTYVDDPDVNTREKFDDWKHLNDSYGSDYGRALNNLMYNLSNSTFNIKDESLKKEIIKEMFNTWKNLKDASVNGRDDKLLEHLADKLMFLLPQIKDESFRNEVETELHKVYDF